MRKLWHHYELGFVLRIVALMGVVVLALSLGSGTARTTTPPKDPLVFRTTRFNGHTVKIVRAVFNGQLIVIEFVHKDGVWFLVDAEPASKLPGNPRPSPKS